MTVSEKRMAEALGLTEEVFDQKLTPQEIAEEAYLIAEYNSILLEMMMEE